MPSFSQTVRFKLTVWYSSLLLVFGVAFVVSLNLAARFDRPGDPGDVRYELVREPGQALTLRPLPQTLQQAEEALYNRNLDNLRTWSLISVVGLALASGVGGYVLSGMMLRPVREMTKVASQISATNLTRRINHSGPDDELKALADTFDTMIGRLEHSFAQQREFVENASHELRTPLAAIRTNIEVTEMDPEVSPEEYRTLLETVKTQTERLTRLSEDLLLLSSAERDLPDLEPIALVQLGREVVRNLTPTAAARGTVLKVEGDDTVEAVADGDSLYRSVFNLVENAIKYAGDGSQVDIVAAKRGDRAEITVQDNGAGIPADALPHIFGRFYRIDRGRSRSEGGTGLGLAIVSELVHSMDGTVTAASASGEGTTFTISLPYHRAGRPQPAAKPTEPALTSG
ncbi:MAG: sensor histidine kinase [Dehalococcoidia bacterium]